MNNWFTFRFSPRNSSNTTMRKEQLKLRSEGNGSVAPLTSDDSDIENESANKEPMSASGDAFDSLLGSKADDSSAPKKSNGVTKVPSPVPDDSDAEKNDTETEGENEADTTDLNKTAEKTATEESVEGDGDDQDGEKEEEQYEVEAVVGTRSRMKETQYYIKWKNYDESQNTWEFESNLNCPDLIADYLEKNPKKEKKEKKVRISLPATREAPKRSATESKSLAESDQESDTDSVKAKSSKKKSNAVAKTAKGRGRPKKNGSKSAPAEKEFEVEKIVDEMMEGGKKYFRIRWKGYGAKSDTWELKKSLNCPDKIKEYENSMEQDDDAEYEVEKIMGEMIQKGKRLFYVKWKNWPESDNSWEAEESVDCADLIEKFRDSCRPVAKENKATKRPAAKAPVQTPKKTKKADSDEERDPLADEDESDEEELQWEVKQILNVRTRRGKKEYFIKWKNCDDSKNSWEPEDGLNCPGLLAAFAKKKK